MIIFVSLKQFSKLKSCEVEDVCKTKEIHYITSQVRNEKTELKFSARL